MPLDFRPKWNAKAIEPISMYKNARFECFLYDLLSVLISYLHVSDAPWFVTQIVTIQFSSLYKICNANVLFIAFNSILWDGIHSDW